MMSETVYLPHLEWQALLVLYRQKDQAFSALRYVGFRSTIVALTKHHPPLAAWVGNPKNNEVHITEAGIALYMGAAEKKKAD